MEATRRRGRRIARVTAALLPPLVVLVVQLALWPIFAPYAWFMFVPALFVTSWIGGRGVAIAASALTTVLIWWFFVPPEAALGKELRHLFAALVFFATGVLIALFHERLRRARRASLEALDALRRSHEETSRLYRKTREVDELKTRFFASVSHELRTPLTLVLGPADKLAGDPTLDERARSELDGIARNARVLLRHVEELLDVVKLDAGRMTPNRSRIDLAQLARLIADPFSTLARDRNIAFVVDAPEALDAELDPEQIRAVVTNLLSNALKFTPDGGRVRITVAEAPGERARIEVADSGPGIPPEEREAVFERFHQLGDRARGGTGLGLAIARDFVLLHGGTIAIGDAPEGGAVARVELPRRAPNGAAAARELSAADAAPARQLADELRRRQLPEAPHVETPATGPLVLVVEDDPDMNRFLCESIAERYRVASAFDGQEGLEAATALVPDVMLVDVMMPRMTGDVLVREVRSIPALDRTAIIVVTARADNELRVRLLREGAQDYLLKPFSVDELRARVDNLVASKRALEAESRLASLVEQAPDAIFVADLEGRFTEVNAAGCTLLGCSREEILGKRIVDFIPPEQVERLRQLRERLLAGGEEVAEGAMRRKDGTYVPVEVSSRILPDGRWQAFLRDISERTRMEERLRQSEGDLKRAQAVARIGSWRLDVQKNDLVWSEETYRIFGVRPGTPMSYEAFLAMVHPDDRERVDREWKAALEGAPYDVEHRISAGGEEKWVRERAELTFDEAGRLIGGIGTTQDIKDQKQIEQALQAAEQRAIDAASRIRAVAEASMAFADAVAALPERGVTSLMTMVAVQARLLTGAEYAAFGVGTDPEKPFDPWIQVGMPAELARRMARSPRPVGTLGVIARQGMELRVPDIRKVAEYRGLPPGHPPITSFLGVPIRFRGKSAGNLYLANKRGAREFTADDQRIAEILASRAGVALETAHLYQSEAVARTWLQAVVDQMPEGVLLLDENGRVTAQNRALRALAGAESDARDRFGNPIVLELLEDREPVAADELPYVRAILHGESVSAQEYEVRRADGSFVHVLVGAAPVLAFDGTRTGAVMAVQDITMLKELERQREEWTSIVAHDLRQPVNVIAMGASVLDAAEASLPPERRAKVIKSIHAAAGTLDRMIGDLMDASRIEAHRMTLERRATSLPALIAEVVERTPEVAGRCEVALAPGSQRHVLADPGRVEQVLTNLLSNAAKYGDPGARIRVDVVPRERELEVIVTNRGPGIAADELPRLFRRFERARTTRGRAPGIGLGLYVSKGLIEAHGGSIWAESTPEGITRFHFTLPYAQRQEAELAHA